MNITLRRSTAILLILCMLAGSLGLVACSQKAPPMATLDDYVISTNVYQFLLSRVKGTLSRAGYSVASADFWETVVDSNGTTYDEYFRQAVLVDARRYLAAMVLFDELKLVLPQSQYDKIDEDIQESITTAGSKSALNSELATFGVNIDMLREIYIMEAKFNYLQDHLYGANGSKIAANVRQEYLDRNAVCYRYVLIRGLTMCMKRIPTATISTFCRTKTTLRSTTLPTTTRRARCGWMPTTRLLWTKTGIRFTFFPPATLPTTPKQACAQLCTTSRALPKP